MWNVGMRQQDFAHKVMPVIRYQEFIASGMQFRSFLLAFAGVTAATCVAWQMTLFEGLQFLRQKFHTAQCRISVGSLLHPGARCFP